jgi:hypothetical protein
MKEHCGFATKSLPFSIMPSATALHLDLRPSLYERLPTENEKMPEQE